MSRIPHYFDPPKQNPTPYYDQATSKQETEACSAANIPTTRITEFRQNNATLRHANPNKQHDLAKIRAAKVLEDWVASCPNDSEKSNWRAVANQMQSEGVFLDDHGRLTVEGDLFANDFTGLIAPHCPLALPDNLTVTGKLDLNFFSGLRELPRGLKVGQSLILTGIKDVLQASKYPVIENNNVINAESVTRHRKAAIKVLSEKFSPKVRDYVASHSH